MTKRILDVSEERCRLSVKNAQLVVEQESAEPVQVPLEEIAVLLVSHPAVLYSQAVLSGLMESGGVFIACSPKRLPSGMMLPLAGHHLQVVRMRAQVNAAAPLCKRAWQQLVRGKVRAQAKLLREVCGEDRGLEAMAARVKSGDAGNLESQAARRYWPALFGGEFRRNQDGGDVNDLLNYGYTVLRGIVARATVAAGLHPSIGVHHHNQYDAYCLADDLMEPLRPVVDAAAVRYIEQHGVPIALGKEEKRSLLEALGARYAVQAEARTLFEIAEGLAVSLAECFQQQRKDLAIPEL